MFEYLYESEPRGTEPLSKERTEKIKASVLSKIDKEEKPMKKRVFIKPLIIAAAVSATALASLATANAATNGAISDEITKTFTLMFKGKPVDAVYQVNENGDVSEFMFSVPDDQGDGEYDITVAAAEGDVSLEGITIEINGDEAEIVCDDSGETNIDVAAEEIPSAEVE